MAASLALSVATTPGAAAQDGYVRYTLDGERGLLARDELSEISVREHGCPMQVPPLRMVTRGGFVRVTTRRGPVRAFELCVVQYGNVGHDFADGTFIPRRRGRPGRYFARARVVLAGHDVPLALAPERMRLTRVQMRSGQIDGQIVGAVLRTPDGVRHPFDAEFSFTLGGRWW